MTFRQEEETDLSDSQSLAALSQVWRRSNQTSPVKTTQKLLTIKEVSAGKLQTEGSAQPCLHLIDITQLINQVEAQQVGSNMAAGSVTYCAAISWC